ncbi:hypothetical protein VT84_04910 [Gemmata sp. SH-PL17]|uniref:hypothetical protein n=1 Tax=Gemmata sp. SH-PL17 TaxID=1630693 RepID=UPI00078BDE75|nr:hypothetical protein [Gemmata sp. SH-PL17]AMV23730.1 hypothetical protein VT84_04910 [Gemmata sp. SH-PL17]
MRCRWSLFALAVVFVGAPAAPGQPPIEPKDGKYVVEFTVDAVAPARPALKHRLLPDPRDLQPGNQIQAFYKCFFEQNKLFHAKESTDKQQKWNTAPLKDLVTEKELVNYGGGAVKQAFYAARLDAVNWELTHQARVEGVELLLPDVQQMRMLTTVMKVRARGEIARGEFGAALQTLQAQFALARTFNEHPTLIGHLVGIALGMVAATELEEFVQQPGAPNLFWALTDLPRPLIDLRKGHEGERRLVGKEYDVLRKAVQVSEPELTARIKMLDTINGLGDGKSATPSAWCAKQSRDKDAVAAATTRLTEAGHKADALAKLSPLQVILMDDFLQYENELDDNMKWTNVPFWRAPADFGTQKHPGAFGTLLPVYKKVTLARVRLEQLVAQLTVVEAVRAHAAENGGQLPTALDAVKLPLPIDPISGKLFVYEVKENRATIRGTPPPGQEQWPTSNRVYEVTVRK